MRFLFGLTVLGMSVGGWVVAQGPEEGLHARQLYYQGGAPKVAAAKPAVAPKKVATVKKRVETATKKVETAAVKQVEAEVKTPTPEVQEDKPVVTTPTGQPVVAAALHFGVRYNVLRVGEAGELREVDPQTVFHTGDRAAIRFRPNRDGYLSVFTQAASGKWKPLLPQPGEDARRYLVRANEEFVFPQEATFRFEQPAGTERLFVVITERPADLEQLNDALREERQGAPAAPAAPAVRPPREQTVLAMNRMDQHMRSMQGELRGRDIVVEKVSRPVESSEPPHSVYVVKAVARADERVVLEIVLRHE